MKLEELRAKKTEELHHELERLRRHLFDLRSQAVTEKLENPMQLGKAKKDVARVLTILRERNERNVEARQAQLSAQAAKRS